MVIMIKKHQPESQVYIVLKLVKQWPRSARFARKLQLNLTCNAAK